MTITFRVEEGHAIPAALAAIITPDQRASFSDLLAEQSLRLSFAMLLPVSDVTGDPWFEFDARLPPVSSCRLEMLRSRSIRSLARWSWRRPVRSPAWCL